MSLLDHYVEAVPWTAVSIVLACVAALIFILVVLS